MHIEADEKIDSNWFQLCQIGLIVVFERLQSSALPTSTTKLQILY